MILVTRTAHVQNDSPINLIFLVMKVWQRLKFLNVKVQGQGHCATVGKKLWQDTKGIITRNAHVKYEALYICTGA